MPGAPTIRPRSRPCSPTTPGIATTRGTIPSRAATRSWPTGSRNKDDPGAWEATYEAWAVEGDRAVATGTSRYDDADGKRLYHNVFLITFDADGRCREFTEIFETREVSAWPMSGGLRRHVVPLAAALATAILLGVPGASAAPRQA